MHNDNLRSKQRPYVDSSINAIFRQLDIQNRDENYWGQAARRFAQLSQVVGILVDEFLEQTKKPNNSKEMCRGQVLHVFHLKTMLKFNCNVTNSVRRPTETYRQQNSFATSPFLELMTSFPVRRCATLWRRRRTTSPTASSILCCVVRALRMLLLSRRLDWQDQLLEEQFLLKLAN